MENWVEKIDLKQRLTEKNNLSRNGWVTFTTQKLSENSLNELAFFSEMLEKVGISLEVTRKQKAESELCYDFVAMKWNEEKYKTVMNRHAGRKAGFEEKYDKYGKCTVEELEERLKGNSKTKIAKELGCSRMTLYRILHNIELRNPAGDISIWHFTS